jgi:predicted deacylase
MINAPQILQSTLVLKESTWIRAKASGIFSCSTRLGEFVRKGELLAQISDPYGQVVVAVKATSNGHVIGVNNNPVVNVGDALIHVGEEG